MYKKYIKRILDLIFSLIGLPFLVILIVPVSILIKIEDGGPIFYNAIRIGKNKVPFKMYKFRTMKVNSPDIRLPDGSTFNSKDDPRVTNTGKILRESSLDETPQLINVLLGNMSLIGPRPDLDLNTNYPEEINFILKAKPGITGYTQSYFRNETTWLDKIKYDLYYVKHLSFCLDLKIMLKTLYIVLKREKTYRIEEKI